MSSIDDCRLLEWRFYYFHMFRNPINQFMHLNPFPLWRHLPRQVQNVTRDGADIDDLAVRKLIDVTAGMVLDSRNKLKFCWFITPSLLALAWFGTLGQSFSTFETTFVN